MAGNIIYSSESGNSRTPFVTKGCNYEKDSTNGLGAGYGWTAGFYTGPESGFLGPSNNLTFDLVIIGFTYSENDTGWGLSFSFGDRGLGLGSFINTSNTIINNSP
ncbi:MAG TPA: hypothetical protein VEI57_05400 [Nitrospirota bacterium]|nr:hypothetical protein [Nitrospirota bacterium]